MGRRKSNAPVHRGQRRSVKPLMSATRTSGIRCRAHRKVEAYSEAEAWAIAEMELLTQGGEPAKRVYECDPERNPGVWHWTRQERYDARG
jgi:hypothetical protein